MENSAGARAEQYHFDPETYLQMIVAEVPAYTDLQDKVAQATRDVVVQRILELGVGTGETSARVLALHPTAQLVGIDESEPMLACAGKRFPDADLRVQRLEDPLPGDSYELIVSALAIHHLDSAGKADLFERVADRLRPGGRFVMADVVVPVDPNDAVTPIDGTYDKPSRVEEQLQWLRDAGLRADVRWAHRDLVVLVADHP